MLVAETFQILRTDYKSTRHYRSSDLGPCGECLLFTFHFLCTRGTRQMQGKTAALPSHVSLQSALSLINLQFPCKLRQKSSIHFASMPSSVTYTTWIPKNVWILKSWQEFSTYTIIHIDQKHTDLEASAEMSLLAQSFNASMNHKYIV